MGGELLTSDVFKRSFKTQQADGFIFSNIQNKPAGIVLQQLAINNIGSVKSKQMRLNSRSSRAHRLASHKGHAAVVQAIVDAQGRVVPFLRSGVVGTDHVGRESLVLAVLTLTVCIP